MRANKLEEESSETSSFELAKMTSSKPDFCACRLARSLLEYEALL